MVSHHVQLCVPGASHIVVLDSGRIQFQGDKDAFEASSVMSSLALSGLTDSVDKEEPRRISSEELDDVDIVKEVVAVPALSESKTLNGIAARLEAGIEGLTKTPRVLVKEETRVVGDISVETWRTYIFASGGGLYWSTYLLIIVFATLAIVAQNMWLEFVLSIMIPFSSTSDGSAEFGPTRFRREMRRVVPRITFPSMQLYENIHVFLQETLI